MLFIGCFIHIIFTFQNVTNVKTPVVTVFDLLNSWKQQRAQKRTTQKCCYNRTPIGRYCNLKTIP